MFVCVAKTYLLIILYRIIFLPLYEHQPFQLHIHTIELIINHPAHILSTIQR